MLDLALARLIALAPSGRYGIIVKLSWLRIFCDKATQIVLRELFTNALCILRVDILMSLSWGYLELS